MNVTLQRLLEVVELFREIDAEFTGPAFAMLLNTALRPGSSLSDMQARLNLSQASVSRNAATLGPKREFRKFKGLGLLEVVDDPHNGRRKQVSLSIKGREVVSRMAKILEGRGGWEEEKNEGRGDRPPEAPASPPGSDHVG